MRRARLPELDVAVAPLDLAWAAGLIDGEGAISLHYSAARQRQRASAAASWRLRVRVTMTDEPTVERLAELFGGRVLSFPARENRRPAWYWQVDQPRAEAVLRALWPYLVTKREHAGLAIAAMTFRRHVQLVPGRPGRGGHRFPASANETLLGIRERIGSMKGPKRRAVDFTR